MKSLSHLYLQEKKKCNFSHALCGGQNLKNKINKQKYGNFKQQSYAWLREMCFLPAECKALGG